MQLSIVLPLGRTGSKEAAVPRLDLRAGPSVTRSGPGVTLRSRTVVAPLTAMTLRPGHSTTWSLAGQPLMASYSQQALRERRDGVPDGERKNISTVGVVAIGVGVAAIVGGLVLYDHYRDIDRNSD